MVAAVKTKEELCEHSSPSAIGVDDRYIELDGQRGHCESRKFLEGRAPDIDRHLWGYRSMRVANPVPTPVRTLPILHDSRKRQIACLARPDLHWTVRLHERFAQRPTRGGPIWKP